MMVYLSILFYDDYTRENVIGWVKENVDNPHWNITNWNFIKTEQKILGVYLPREIAAFCKLKFGI